MVLLALERFPLSIADAAYATAFVIAHLLLEERCQAGELSALSIAAGRGDIGQG